MSAISTEAAWELLEEGRGRAPEARRWLAPGEFERTLDRIAARDTDPYSAVDEIFDRAVGIPRTSRPDL